MIKTFVLGAALVLGTTGIVVAQDAQVSEQDSAAGGGPGARAGHITATGETVPNPGASQGAGTTSLDRGIQAQDNKIDSGICKGC